MDMLGIVLLWFANILTSIFNNDLVGEDKKFSLEDVQSAIEAIEGVFWLDFTSCSC